MNTLRKIITLSFLLGELSFFLPNTNFYVFGAGPSISAITAITTGAIEKYDKFEISFNITDIASTNLYFPYDTNTPTGVLPGTGISVDMLLLQPSQTNWSSAKTLPCFYFQPYEEVGAGKDISLLPKGKAEWRCRFTPDAIGNWSYKIRVQDQSGISESTVSQFTAVNSTRKGFIRVSQTDPRFFEFSNSTPFTAPLINLEEGNPFISIFSIRTNIQKLGQGGIHFVRWFPTGEGSNNLLTPFGDDIGNSWEYGDRGAWVSGAEPATGHLFGYFPYYYTYQFKNLTPGKYRLTARTKVWGDAVLRLELGRYKSIDICSTTGTFHQSQGYTCDYVASNFNNYTLETTVPESSREEIAMRGLYVSTGAETPFDIVRTGNAIVNTISLQKDETGNSDWGPNLLQRGDTETYKYIDQISAIAMDELLKVSEQYGVYHKLTLFHKNDNLLNRFLPDGTVTASWDDINAPNARFYSADGQAGRWYQRAYTRYFIARWSYSPALHSLEIANENHFYDAAYNASFSLADYINQTSPRKILNSNSFWGWFIADNTDPAKQFWNNPTKGYLMDYADKHWYAKDPNGDGIYGGELVSAIWNDSAANVRECRKQFNNYRRLYGINKPIVRGETGVSQTGQVNATDQHPDISKDLTGTWYHKKVWAQVGMPGDNCDGEWYPRTFNSGGAYPNATYDTFKIYKTYDNFMNGEPVNNGHYQDIGTDLTGNQQITISGQTGKLRAFGGRDSVNGKALLWIDNANQTWKNVVDGVVIANAGGTLTIQGLPQGTYQGQWWNTRTGAATTTQNYTVDTSGTLSLTVSNLSSDTAIKFTNTTIPTPTTAPPTTTPTPSHCTPLGDLDCSGKVNILDLSALLSAFGSTTNKTADLDNSGKVNMIDLSILLQNFGK